MMMGVLGCASAQHMMGIHIESHQLNPEQKEKIKAFMKNAHDQMEVMEHEMDGRMSERMNGMARGQNLRGQNFFGPPPANPEDGDGPHGFFARMFGPPPPRPEDEEMSGEFRHAPPPPFFARMFGPPPPPPPRPEDEELEEHPRHHHGHHDFHHVEALCREDHEKFCAETHHPFFVTRCLNKHHHEISKKCAEALPKHPLRCLVMHLLMSTFMFYMCYRILRIAQRWYSSGSISQHQYPGHAVIIAQEVDNSIHLGKVVPVELMPPIEEPTKVVSV